MRFFLLAVLLGGTASSQTTVEGLVTDAQTGEGLPAATVRVEGTSRGTITNRDGAYSIEIPAGGDTLEVRFLGYETARRAVPASGVLDVALAPAVASIGEAVVTAGNPAENIMRRVIERKARWQSGLETWQADVYSRQTMSADGQIIGVIEGQSTAFWVREVGFREVVTAKRTTGNLSAIPAEAFGAAEQTINFYDDEIPFGGYDLMGPTNPRALSFYRFALEGRRAVGTDLIFDLSFAPKNPLQPGLQGRLSVLADADALIALEARPSGAVQFPLVNQFDLALEQQFASFGQSIEGEPVWLPVDFRMVASGKPGNALLRFPDLGFAISSRFSDYALNVAVPDSLLALEGGRAAVDSASVARALPVAGVVPLSMEEERAFAEIDSTRSFTEAIRPTGPLARFVNIGVSGAPGDGGSRPRGVRFGFDPAAWYNRVEGATLGGSATVRINGHRLTLEGAYQTGANDVALEVDGSVRVSESVYAGADVHRDVASLGQSIFVERSTNTIAALTGGEDYFDYVERRGARVWIGRYGQAASSLTVNAWAAYDETRSASVTSDFSLVGDLAPETVSVLDADRWIARTGGSVRIGSWSDGLNSGLTGQRAAVVRFEGGRLNTAEFSDIDDPDGNSTYGRLEGEVRWSQPTVLRRRLLAPTLHLRLAAGTATDGLPLERSFGIDTQLAGLSSFGALRARDGRMLLARQYALVAWEHDFRSVPFELFGWRGASPRGLSFQIHGAHAWATGSPGAFVEPSVVHHEVGASIGAGYAIPLRLDVTYRLTDDPGFVVGFGIARLF
ncbi:DUF5686 family protein [Rubrivirga sp.]|uniref:DUF5686 and carboxypeptidase-like regulatory domain-containing protein n=1 Tax=Rubrivirga sp. TaxID=1885344 RepID=UPI003C70B113